MSSLLKFSLTAFFFVLPSSSVNVIMRNLIFHLFTLTYTQTHTHIENQTGLKYCRKLYLLDNRLSFVHLPICHVPLHVKYSLGNRKMIAVAPDTRGLAHKFRLIFRSLSLFSSPFRFFPFAACYICLSFSLFAIWFYGGGFCILYDIPFFAFTPIRRKIF